MKINAHQAPRAGTLKIGELTLGGGTTAVIVPLTAKTVAESIEAAHCARGKADLVEWRLDLLATSELEKLGLPGDTGETGGVQADKKLLRSLDDIRCAAKTPVLATVRTKEEGGCWEGTGAAYRQLVLVLAAGADLVDVEVGSPNWSELTLQARALGAAVVASKHDFSGTPGREELVETLTRMQLGGAQVAKIAVTPTHPGDVLTLLTATYEVAKTARTPVITVSMGQLGAVSRLAGAVFGSCASFGCVGGQTSAPGQIDAQELARVAALLGVGPTR